MRPLLVTAYDASMAAIGDLTAPLMEAYAMRHAMSFEVSRCDGLAPLPTWQKMHHVRLALLQGREQVLWLDADMVITNPDAEPWRPMTEGLFISRDWGKDAGPDDFSTGAFLATPDALPMIDEALKLREKWGTVPFHEQSALREVYATHHWARELTHILPRRTFNAVPREAQKASVEPWEPGDWLCHLTGIANEKRGRLFKKFTKEGVKV